KDASQRYPFLLTRTPYSVAPYGVDNYRASLGPSESFEREGFIFVYQDARGRYMSEGEFLQVRPYVPDKRGPKDVDESTDTYDTIEWLLKNVPNNNGRVGMVGISQPGFHVAASIIDSHPALKAASPQAPTADYYMGDDVYHNGAFMLAANFGFYSSFVPRRDGPEPPRQRVRFDPGTVNQLVMGPWPHGGWARLEGDKLGNLNFAAKTGEFFREQIQFPFFMHYLKDKPADLPEAFMFLTGINEWRRLEAWPPKEAR